MRLRTGPQNIRLDEEWRRSMRPSSKLKVTALSLPGLLRYGYHPGDVGGANGGG